MTTKRATRIYKPTMHTARVSQETRHETVPEFVSYFYEFARDDAAMVRLLDRALKERYGSR